jgi:hypothetical protein
LIYRLQAKRRLEMNKILKMCLNWKVLAAIAVGALLLAVAVPGFRSGVPVLLFLIICPLMMFLMMTGMQSGASHDSPPSEHTATDTRNAMTTETAVELRAQREQISNRIAVLEASPSHLTLENPDRGRL